MEVKPGYKHSEVGVILEEWELTPFVSLGRVIDGDRGTNYPGSRDFSSDGHCLFLNAGNVTKAGFRFSECAFISHEKDEQLSKGKLKRDDIVLTTRGTVGNFAHFDSAVSFEHIRINSGMVILRNESAALDTTFLYALLQSHFVEKQIERLTFGSAQPQLTVKGINEFAIVVPPVPEQRAIATALSDVDGLLGGLDRLIAKKRDLKQAAMQQLLTGQTRLPGFHGEWEVKRLGEICEIAMGRTPPRLNQAFWGHGYKWLSIADLQTKVVSDSKEEITELAASTMTIIPKGTLLMSFKLSLGRLCFAGCDLFTNEAICSFNKLQANAEFLYYVLGRTDFSLYGKQAVKGYTLNKESLKIIEVTLPPHPEQTAIAEVLTEMDAELAGLEQRREKTRALKQAMMQELLTGRTRLVAGAEVTA
jgi:type I restriction enzyme S subunit